MFAFKQPQKEWKVREGVPTLERMQKIVGGYIEHVFIPGLENSKGGFRQQIDIFANEEGRLKNLPPNIVTLEGTLLVGTILAIRHDSDGETASLIEGDLELLQKLATYVGLPYVYGCHIIKGEEN